MRELGCTLAIVGKPFVSRVRFNEVDLEPFRPKVQKILSLSKLCRGKIKIKISPGI
jgi:hypothetical protein